MSIETRTYRHLPTNVPMEMAAGAYWISAEERIPFDDRDVLFTVRDTDCITSCCGESQGFRSIGVVGYVIEWHSTTEDERPCSVVERITDLTAKEEISKILRKKYRIQQIEFV